MSSIQYKDCLAIETGFHAELKLHFKRVESGIIFEDNIFYDNNEIEALRNKKKFDYKTIHDAKKLFNGIVLSH